MRGDFKQLQPKQVAANFNPRPFVRGDEILNDMDENTIHFNPRPFVRGDLYPGAFVPVPTNFNPRPFVRGDA